MPAARRSAAGNRIGGGARQTALAAGDIDAPDKQFEIADGRCERSARTSADDARRNRLELRFAGG